MTVKLNEPVACPCCYESLTVASSELKDMVIAICARCGAVIFWSEKQKQFYEMSEKDFRLAERAGYPHLNAVRKGAQIVKEKLAAGVKDVNVPEIIEELIEQGLIDNSGVRPGGQNGTI